MDPTTIIIGVCMILMCVAIYCFASKAEDIYRDGINRGYDEGYEDGLRAARCNDRF